ncbi:MAG TPA: DUF2291 domain-containing protein [Devosiaceae bacterium]
MKIRTFALIAIAVATLPMAGCKVVSDQELAQMAEKSGAKFDPAGYVERIWTDQVIPTLTANAVDADTLLGAVAKDPDVAGKTYGHRAGEGNPWSYEIKGSGKVVSVDTSSRHGLMTLEIAGADGSHAVSIQIGPVVFGTALRDSLPFIKFGDFVNQLQFAQISRALNDRAVKDVTASFDATGAEGKTVRFVGATTINPGSTPIQVTPVTLAYVDGGGS